MTRSGDCLHSNDEEGVSQLVLNSGKVGWVNHSNAGLVWVGYKSHAIQFYEETDAFLKVHLGGKDYWVKKEQLRAKGIKWTVWKAFFNSLSTGQLECIYNMNLRKEPRSTANKITLLQKNRGGTQYHLMQLTGRFDGLWAEVTVRIWDRMSDACSDKKQAVKTYTGWIKHLDDAGYPNIFHIPTPCC